MLKNHLNRKRERAITIADGLGLSARVSPSGKVTWQQRYRIEGAERRLDLGSYPEISIAAARDLSAKCRQWLEEGKDPKIQREMERKDTLCPFTVQDALEYWLTEYAEYKRANVDRHRAQFAKHIYPHIGRFPLAQVELRHWIECFDAISKGTYLTKAAPVAAGYVLQNVKQALKFCRVRGKATNRVLDDLNITDVGKKQRKKDRVLTDAELASLWEWANEPDAYPYYHHLVKLLIVFGSRTHELRLSTWAEWNFQEGTWTVPAKHSKSDTKIVRAIPAQMVPWLLELKEGAGHNDLILCEKKRPEAVSQKGRLLWKALGHSQAWTLHDIRRTFATKLNDLGVAPYVVEKMLGHSMGGVMAIYNRSLYLPEQNQALERWLNRLATLKNNPSNLYFLPNMSRSLLTHQG